MSFSFTYEEYILLLIKMRQIAPIITLNSYSQKSFNNGYILRHDVDLDLDKAYEMSKIEKEIGIASSYFILSTSDMYNINSKKNRIIINDMLNEGFEIGLHFDPTIYGDINEHKLHMYVMEEVDMIQTITGKKLESISLHNPSISNRFPIFTGFNNAYDGALFSDELYLSDSCKNFRNKEIYSFIKKGETNVLQMVFHPIHFAEKTETYYSSFLKILYKRVLEIDDLMKNNKNYKEGMSLTNLSNLIYNMREDKDDKNNF